ncbi:unnamed protein product [Didymodactylos carnosus]|uniref:Leucine-rich repeat-containing protein 45 n=1 Tax=Didymodactylos carnosus TaxID=1234261 RepID=A0A815RLV1_9BILA|nr:unnamed protein product [Didymodactylos carnosus]CAF4344940.1 unnamed protein product [Didymodactylos carnosus]
MDHLKKLYHEYCKSYNVEPNELLLGEIQKVSADDNKTKSLNLSSFNIPDTQCTVLGKLLFIISLHCFIHLLALQALLHGLYTNTTCKTLELKGNNIHGGATEALAKLMRKNKTLRNLRLEWNQLGQMDTPAFSVFCDALADNKGLIELDLRNNSISHVGASELASALKRNTTLRMIDLRWNNVGLIGGRALLAVCESNSTLTDIQLVGNNIPDDIMQSIANALVKNEERRQTNFGHLQNMSVLTRQLQNVQNDKDRQITTVLTRMSLQEQAMLKANRSLAEKLKKLQEALDDRKLSFNALSAKVSLLEADLTVASQQYNDAQNEIKKLEMEKEQLVHKIRRECKQEKDELMDIQEKLNREIHENLDTQRRLTERGHDLERKCEQLQSTVHDLRETIALNDRDHQLKQSTLADENQRLKAKHKEELKDFELITTRDLHRLKEEYGTNEQILKDQLIKLETIRSTLEREVNSLKSTISTQKLNFEENTQHEKLRIKNEEEKKQRELEDRLRAITTSKEELDSRYNQQLLTNRELQQKIGFQSVEIETFKRQIESVQMTIMTKDTEILEGREKAKTEYEKKLRIIQRDIDTNEELKDKIKKMENDLKDQQHSDRQIIRDLEVRIGELQTTLNKRDQELNRLRREEDQRLSYLRTALLDYIGKGKSETS